MKYIYYLGVPFVKPLSPTIC